MDSPIRLPLKGSSLYEKVMNYVEKQGECLVFTKGKGGYGYGYVSHNKVRARAHRVVMEHHYGASPLEVLHSCDNPPCVNIDHLRYGTHRENMEDRKMRGRGRTRGRENIHNKINEDTVITIYHDQRNQDVIAEELGLHQTTVSNIKNGKSWSWLTQHKSLIKQGTI